MINVVLMEYEDHVWKIDSVFAEIEDSLEKARIEQRVIETNICDDVIREYPFTEEWINKIATILGVSRKLINLECERYRYDNEIKSLGFSEEDISVIEQHFILCHISMVDWEAMQLVECIDDECDEDEILKLPSGKWVIFGNELLHKALLSEMDD